MPRTKLVSLALGLVIGCGAARHKMARNTLPTAYDTLCAGGRFVGQMRWEESGCSMFSPTCQMLTIACPSDERVDALDINWHKNSFGTGTLLNLIAPRTGYQILDGVSRFIGTQKGFEVDRMATPASMSGQVYRFFLWSDGCEKQPHQGCELPWPTGEEVRPESKIVGVTHFYLVYDDTEPGHPKVSIEMDQFVAEFSKSSFQLLGTGEQAPPPLMFAGATGTGCGKGLPCDTPLHTPDPVESKVFEATFHHLMEYPVGSGEYRLKTDTNWGMVMKTVVYSFKPRERK